jgi:hypothetical protein
MEGITRRPVLTRPADLSAVGISQPSENSKAMPAVGRIAFSAVVVGGALGCLQRGLPVLPALTSADSFVQFEFAT